MTHWLSRESSALKLDLRKATSFIPFLPSLCESRGVAIPGGFCGWKASFASRIVAAWIAVLSVLALVHGSKMQTKVKPPKVFHATGTKHSARLYSRKWRKFWRFQGNVCRCRCEIIRLCRAGDLQDLSHVIKHVIKSWFKMFLLVLWVKKNVWWIYLFLSTAFTRCLICCQDAICSDKEKATRTRLWCFKVKFCITRRGRFLLAGLYLPVR